MTRTATSPSGVVAEESDAPGSGLPRTWGHRIAEVATLERPADRLILALAVVILTLTSPFITLPGGLPAIRLEQLVLLVAAIPALAFLARHREMRSVGVVDAGFLALAISTLATLILTPIIVPGVTRSYRDVFEVVRIAQYWLVFRIGLTLVPPDAASLRVGRVLSVAAIVLGLVAVLQYLNPPAFNDVITAVWTQTHNLLGVVREGRAVGTAGNPNQFGILAVLLLWVALAGRLAAPRGERTWPWTIAIAASTAAVVLAQSRGAILGMALGLLVAMVLLLVRRSFRRGIVVAAPAMAAAVLVLVPLIVLAPPSSGSIARRLSFAGLASDPSVVVRIGRIESLGDPGSANHTGAGAGTAAGGDNCLAALQAPSKPSPGHEPGAAAPPAAPTADAAAVASAVAAFYCQNGAWPTDLAHELVPAFLPAVPASLGDDFGIYSSPRGFVVGNASSITSPDEESEAGSFPNFLANPSFEGTGSPSSWLTTPGTTLLSATGGAAFGSSAGIATLPAGGGAYQLIVADLPPTTDYTAGIWIRPLDAGATSLQLYVTAVTADGRTIDPLGARVVEIPAGAGWQHLAVAFETPASHLTSLQVMVRAPGASAHVLLDGASLTEGPFAIPFGSLSDAPASSAGDGPSFQDSPILGLGPQKDEGVAVFDNEYASFLVHYGILGLVAYGLLFFAAFLVGLRAALRVPDWGGFLGVALTAFTVALGVFAVPAGAYRQLQVMLIYWLIVGIVVAISSGPRTSAQRTDAGPV